MINELNKNVEILAKARKEAQAFFEKHFKEAVKEFFAQVPEVQAVCWEQYTPYFNDGDPCVFSLNEIFFVAEGFDKENLNNPYEYDKCYLYNVLYTIERGIPYYLKEAKAQLEELGEEKCLAIDNFYRLLSNSEHFLEEMFSEATIYLTPSEIIVEECIHD